MSRLPNDDNFDRLLLIAQVTEAELTNQVHILCDNIRSLALL